MKASKIIKYLENYISDYGDQDVYLYTDHGQTDSKVVSVDYLETEDEDIKATHIISIYGE